MTHVWPVRLALGPYCQGEKRLRTTDLEDTKIQSNNKYPSELIVHSAVPADLAQV